MLPIDISPIDVDEMNAIVIQRNFTGKNIFNEHQRFCFGARFTVNHRHKFGVIELSVVKVQNRWQRTVVVTQLENRIQWLFVSKENRIVNRLGIQNKIKRINSHQLLDFHTIHTSD